MSTKGGKSPALLSPPRGKAAFSRAERACRKALQNIFCHFVHRSKKARPVGRALCLRFAKEPFLQVLLVALDHLLDHLAADRAGLAGGQIAVVALLEVDADLPWCTPNILKCLSRVSLRYDKGEQMPGTSQRETGAAPVYREDTIGVMSRSTGLLRQETLELEGPPAHQ